MRTLRGRLSLLVVSGVISTAVVAVGLAWACTPEASISLGSAAGAPGSAVLVDGSGFSNGRVELHWGSQAGPVLGSVTGPSFRSSLAIPQTEPGVYMISAIGFDLSGAPVGQSALPFEVTGPEPAAEPAPAPSSSPAPTPDALPAASATEPAPTKQPAPAHGGVTKHQSSQPSKSTAPSQRPAPAAQAPARSQNTGTRSTPANPPVVTTQSGRAVFGGSVAPSAPSKARGADRGAHRRPAAPTSSPATGQQSNRPAAQPSVATGPSLLPSVADPQMQPSSPESTLMLGIGLLGIGMVVMFAGALVAAVRRRRVPAETGVPKR